MVQQIARKEAVAFRVPAVQEEVASWWEAPMSIGSLGWQDFLPHHDFHGTRNLRETQKEETLAQAKALQHCMERLGAPSGVLCSTVRDLQRCMKPLMCLKGDNVLEALLFGATDNEPGVSLILAEATLLGGDSAPQEVQEIITHPPYHQEETPESEAAAEVADPQNAWEWIPLLPLGFGLPMQVSCSPPLEDAEPLVSIPREAQLDISSLTSMEVITVRNAATEHYLSQWCPIPEPICSLRSTWYWPGINGLVNQVSTCS